MDDQPHVEPVGDLEMGLGGMNPPAAAQRGQQQQQQQLGEPAPNRWVFNQSNSRLVAVIMLIMTLGANNIAGGPRQEQLREHVPDRNSMLIVATLSLAYQLGTSIPGGRWQDAQWDKDGKLLHQAGDSIMRDVDRPRYYLFMLANWVGFASSMVMTLSLLLWMPVDSRHVRWSFVVACSSLVLTFVMSQSRTHLLMDVLIWAAAVAFLWITMSLRQKDLVGAFRAFCCKGHDN